MNKHWSKAAITFFLSVAASQLHAEMLSTPNVFSAGERAVASEVNENFSAIEAAFNALVAKVESLESQLADANNEIATLKDNSVLSLDGWLTFDDTGEYPAAVFGGVNVQIVNDLGVTGTTNGTGNLIVGYNEEHSLSRETCSDGGHWDDQAACESDTEVWGKNFRSGSHNLIVGLGHSYSQHSGLLAGTRNTATGASATVLGVNNLASGYGASVTGGNINTASGAQASISGGSQNKAAGALSTVSGGSRNEASGTTSAVSGGWNREASGSQNWAAGSLLENQ